MFPTFLFFDAPKGKKENLPKNNPPLGENRLQSYWKASGVLLISFQRPGAQQHTAAFTSTRAPPKKWEQDLEDGPTPLTVFSPSIYGSVGQCFKLLILFKILNFRKLGSIFWVFNIIFLTFCLKPAASLRAKTWNFHTLFTLWKSWPDLTARKRRGVGRSICSPQCSCDFRQRDSQPKTSARHVPLKRKIYFWQWVTVLNVLALL